MKIRTADPNFMSFDPIVSQYLMDTWSKEIVNLNQQGLEVLIDLLLQKKFTLAYLYTCTYV